MVGGGGTGRRHPGDYVVDPTPPPAPENRGKGTIGGIILTVDATDIHGPGTVTPSVEFWRNGNARGSAIKIGMAPGKYSRSCRLVAGRLLLLGKVRFCRWRKLARSMPHQAC